MTRLVANENQSIDTKGADRSKELIVPRLLASVISLTVVGLGVLAIMAQHYFGKTSKLGSAEVSLDGASAIAMGLSTIFFGLAPLALWFRTKRAAIVWMVTCFIAAGVAFYVSIQLRHV